MKMAYENEFAESCVRFAIRRKETVHFGNSLCGY